LFHGNGALTDGVITGLVVVDVAKDGTASPNVVAMPVTGGTIYKLTYPLTFPGVTLMSAASATQVDSLFFVLNIAGQTAGTFYIDNIVLHTDAVCPPATATPTVTRTMTPTFTRTSTPVATFTSTVTPTRTSTGTPGARGPVPARPQDR
jgi:hypothetical protein